MDYSQDTDFSSEIVIGIVGPIGCNRELVIRTIKKLSKHYSYDVDVVKVSDIIRKYKSVVVDEKDQYTRVTRLMDAGNDLRREANDNSILAKMSAVDISNKRSNFDSKRIIYVIDSLKHPEEVTSLRDIYGDGFYLLAVHSDENMRNNFLEKYCHIKDAVLRDNLIKRDKDEEIGYGQSTSSAFHLADFFLTESGDHTKIWNSLERYFDLIFGNPFRTPTFQEYAMFMAHASSIRSSDLSRQVGAVITHETDIISTGSNECPKAFGGTYWPLFNTQTKEIYDAPDGRDHTRGKDHNAYEKKKILDSLRKDLDKESIKILNKNINRSGINDITEYGRVVHAEMDAILGCARRGISTLNSVMFCTTYPCHNCAKHIVASGITKVIYIEPYPKSKALDMHNDSITIDNSLPRKRVLFRPFMGVGPRQYINLFSLHLSAGKKVRRKVRGGYEKKEWTQQDATPRVKMLDNSYIEIENFLSEEINKAFKPVQ